MSPRRYDRSLRMAASEEAKRRIVEAAAELHARHGARGTSHAMIARKAGVSIPTVYKHFPTANHLVPACTGLVAGRAPLAPDEALFRDLRDLPSRVHALAGALFRLHEYFAPWFRWSDADAPALPALRDFLKQVRERRGALIRRAMTVKGSKAPPPSLLAFAGILLDFTAWRTLTESGRTTGQAAAEAADALLAVCRSHSFPKETP